MTDHVKVYEEKKSGLPIWAWLLPLLLILGIVAYFLTRHHDQPAPAATAAPVAQSATPSTVEPLPTLGAVHFDTDKATLTADGKATLDRAAAVMKANPNVHLRLEGYTDSTGTDAHNLPLSDQRTYTVADYLKAQGIDGKRLTGGGFGEANPADTNATAAGKADNRRVELFTQP